MANKQLVKKMKDVFEFNMNLSKHKKVCLLTEKSFKIFKTFWEGKRATEGFPRGLVSKWWIAGRWVFLIAPPPPPLPPSPPPSEADLEFETIHQKSATKWIWLRRIGERRRRRRLRRRRRRSSVVLWWEASACSALGRQFKINYKWRRRRPSRRRRRRRHKPEISWGRKENGNPGRQNEHLLKKKELRESAGSGSKTNQIMHSAAAVAATFAAAADLPQRVLLFHIW